MKKKNDKKFMYGIKKLALDFKNSTQTSNYQEIEDLIVFAESFFSENDIENNLYNEIALFLHQLTGHKLETIKMETDLINDLGMTKTDKGFMKKGFNIIKDYFNGKKRVFTSECKNCTTVKDCVNLIKSKL